MFKAIIYDMDGLLIDSMIYWTEDTKKFLATRGIELTPEITKYFTGKGVRQSMTWLKKEFGLVDSVEDLCESRHGRIDKIYNELCEAMPGADYLIKKASQMGWKQAIATGAPLKAAEITARRFDWLDHLDELISVDLVDHVGKPDPGVFLYAAKLLRVKPEECVVFEDAENGVVAARAAGMKCIAIPDERWSVGDFSDADLIADSLEDKKVFDFLDL